MAVSEILDYVDSISSAESDASRALAKKFSLSALIESANENAHRISDSDWSALLAELDLPKSRLQINDAPEELGIQDINLDELELVAGGYGSVAAYTNAVVATQVAVNAIVYANVAVATFVVVAGAGVVVVVAFL
ncbi:MAG: hypothetical protein E6R12_10640 [Sphingomonadales bacterium]|nr:MAG: hypothetical protein E6R12_10640 [Sphingomonadales bacterium]